MFVGPVACGQYRFVFQADPPDFTKIPGDDIVGVTIILLTCSYRDQEFLRVGYYVNNEYADEALRETPPPEPQIDLYVFVQFFLCSCVYSSNDTNSLLTHYKLQNADYGVIFWRISLE